MATLVTVVVGRVDVVPLTVTARFPPLAFSVIAWSPDSAAATDQGSRNERVVEPSASPAEAGAEAATVTTP
jgi:hypothetical protein